MTSVKEFVVSESPTADALGRGQFHFTDDYSVFDWGKMPDPIPGKGASLCAMGAYNFELLADEGVPTHYRGVIPDGSGESESDPDAADTGARPAADPISIHDATTPPRRMAIDVAQVPDLPREGRDYDYDAFHRAAGDCYVVPLEVVFRNTVPVGSSLRRRADPADVGLDRDAWPEETVTLPEPVVEFSTKFEESDRYLTRAEADRIAGRADVDRLEALARTANRVVTERAEAVGLTHHDGKIECLYHAGEVRVADVVGTFDENRFSHDGQQVSKEVLRQYHKRAQPGWVDAVDAAKSEASERGVADWRTLCDRDPEPLPASVVGAAADLYAAGANAYLGRDLFDAPALAAAVAVVADL